MKPFLTFVLALLAVSSLAQQNPSFRSFDTNYFTTNGMVIGIRASAVSQSYTNSKALFVDKNGTTGVRGVDTRPYPKLELAAAAAQPGDTIVCYGGNYTNTGNLLRKGVNYSFVGYTSISNMDAGTGVGAAVFDDRVIGATTNVIEGLLDIYQHAGTNFSGGPPPTGAGNQNCKGAIVITNERTDVVFRINRINFTYYAGLQDNGAVHIKNCRHVSVICNSIDDPAHLAKLHWSAPDPIDDVDFEPNSAGVWWGSGETYIKADTINSSGYGLYASEPPETSPVTANLWMDVDHLLGKFYSAAGSSSFGYRVWLKSKWFEPTNSPAITILGGGKFYIETEKLSGKPGENLVEVTDGGELWLTAQKLTVSNANWARVYQSAVSGGKLWMNVQQFEDLGDKNATGGFFCSAGEMNVTGISAAITNCPAIIITGGKATFRDMVLKSASNCVAFVSGGTLNFANSTLIACTNAIAGGPASTNAISAGSAKTVGIYGHVMANRTNNANITLSPLGAFTVDTNVK